MGQLRKLYTRVEDSTGVAVGSAAVSLLRVGAEVTRDATGGGINQVGVRHPGALVTSDICYVIRNGSVISDLTVTLADPSWTYDSGNGDWYMEFVSSGGTYTPTAGDRLVLTGLATGHFVNAYDNDSRGGTATTAAITAGSDGVISKWVDAQDVDIKVVSGGVTTYITDLAIEGRNYVSVDEFGATGDNSTDDTNAIQAAIDYVISQNGGVVFFPPGLYRIKSGPLRVTIGNSTSAEQITLLGSGKHESRLLQEASGTENLLEIDGWRSAARSFKISDLGFSPA
jgi:hypothetical protein